MRNESLTEKMRAAGLLAIEDAARLAGRPAATVRRWCRQKRVEHVRSGGRWFVRRASLESFVGILFPET